MKGIKSYKVRIKTISPIHIGTGRFYAPTEFFVNEQERWLGILDFPKWCEAVCQWKPQAIEKFMRLCSAKNTVSFINLLEFVDQISLALFKSGRKDFVKRRIELSQGFLELYKSFKAKKADPIKLSKEFNRFEILSTAYSPNKTSPILPGSSVKGAIRTAILNIRRSKAKGHSAKDYCPKCYGKRERRICREGAKKLEKEILEYSNPKTDPFKLIKVSDFLPLESSCTRTKITFAVNIKKDGMRASGPYQILEVVEAGAIFEGTITILPPTDTVKRPITFKEILQALKNFYRKEMEQKIHELASIGVNFKIPQSARPQSTIVVPIILGRHSGAECVTIEGFRSILIRGPGGRTHCLPHATTLWLASETPRNYRISSLKPFGWTYLEVAEQP